MIKSKNFIYSLIIFFNVFLVTYYYLFNISYYLIYFLIISTWSILIFDKREFALIFCIIGYLHPFPQNQFIDLSNFVSFNYIFIFLLFLTVFILRIWEEKLPETTYIGSIIWIFIFYQIIFSIVPNFLTYELSLSTLLYEKDMFLGILFIYPGYYLGMRFFKSTILFFFYFSFFFVIILFLILFDLVSLIELSTTAVNTGLDGVERLHGLQFGQLFKIFIYAIPAAFLFKKWIKIFLLYIGLSFYIILIFGFSRYELIYITLGLIMTLFIMFKFDLKNKSFFVKSFSWIIIFIISLFTIISSFLPNINIIDGFFLTIEASKYADSFFTLSHRFNTIMPNQLNLFFSSFWNFIFGEGFNDIFRLNILTDLDLGIWDVPLTGTLAKFGILGFSIYILIYLSIIKEIIFFIKILNIKRVNILNESNSEVYLFLIVMSSYFITSIFFRTYVTNIELATPFVMIEFSFLIGMFLSSMQKIRLKLSY